MKLKKPVRNAAVAGFFGAALMAIVPVLGFIISEDKFAALPGFIDPLLILVLSYFVYRNNKFASVLLFMLFTGAMIYRMFLFGKPLGILPAMIVMYFLALGIREHYFAKRPPSDSSGEDPEGNMKE